MGVRAQEGTDVDGTILDQIRVGICIVDRSLSVLLWNRTLTEWTGITEQRALQTNLVELYPQLGESRYRRRFEEVFETGCPAVFSSTLHKHFLPAKTLRGGGDGLMIQQTTVCPERRDPSTALIVIEDVTAQHHQIQALRIERNRLREANDRAEQEVEERKHGAARLLEANHTLELQARKLADQRATAMKMMQEADLARRAAEGAERRLRKSQLQLAERAEALAVSNAELEQFAYVASHDLQEPLRKITSCCQILQDDYADKLDDDGKQWIGFVRSSAQRMRSLIKDLLAFSRIGRQELPTEEVDTALVCRRAIENLQASIEEAGAEITCRPLPQVLADETPLGQLLQNLIGNGIKYRSDRAPEIEIGAESEGDFWRFDVRDNGIGIRQEWHERIFGMFQRLHRKEEYSGTGIGLAICKKIVERVGGRIWLESTPGRGSTFFFTWPKHGVAQDEHNAEPVLSAD